MRGLNNPFSSSSRPKILRLLEQRPQQLSQCLSAAAATSKYYYCVLEVNDQQGPNVNDLIVSFLLNTIIVNTECLNKFQFKVKISQFYAKFEFNKKYSPNCTAQLKRKQTLTSFLVFGEILIYFFAKVFSASFKNTKAVIRNKLTEKEEKMEQPYHFTNLTLVGEDDELRLCDLKQNGNLYPHAVSCMGLAAGSFGLVSLQPQVQFCRRVVCKTGHSTSTSPPPTQFSISEYHRLLNIKGFFLFGFFRQIAMYVLIPLSYQRIFTRKKEQTFKKGAKTGYPTKASSTKRSSQSRDVHAACRAAQKNAHNARRQTAKKSQSLRTFACQQQQRGERPPKLNHTDSDLKRPRLTSLCLLWHIRKKSLRGVAAIFAGGYICATLCISVCLA